MILSNVNSKVKDDQLDLDSYSSNKGNVNNESISNEKNNTSSRGSNRFRHVTQSQGHILNNDNNQKVKQAEIVTIFVTRRGTFINKKCKWINGFSC